MLRSDVTVVEFLTPPIIEDAAVEAERVTLTDFCKDCSPELRAVMQAVQWLLLAAALWTTYRIVWRLRRR
jgi:hypothetical protein